MATSRSPRVTFITPLALTFVAIVTLGATGKNLSPDVKTTNESVVAFASGACDYGGCPVEKGYVLYNKRCLKLYTIEQEYETARKRCEADGAHLFYIKSREEDVPALVHLMDTMGQVLSPSANFWIGANDIVKEGSFLWNDGTPLSSDSGLWDGANPSNTGDNEDCVHVHYNNYITLNDLDCMVKAGFVCQVNIEMH